ncbi:MAG: helix-turn-helix domain-containing protein [Bacteroidetes bacterium]|nr:helix-turn-helix domain-containing protein [Bacteroidota bacterium]
MLYEIKDAPLNGYLSLSNGFTQSSGSFALTYYTFIWNQGGSKNWEVDTLPLAIPSHAIFSLSPGQVISVSGSSDECVIIQFNREFYCLQDHDHEVSCNGMLFNGVLSTPMLLLDEVEQRSFGVLLEVITEEFNQKDEVQVEMLKTVLKRFIIKCTRLAKNQFADCLIVPQELDIIRHYSALVEKHFRSLHRVTDYADMLNKSPKTLSNVFKALGDRTPLQIIHERIILEAKKLLLYTDKSVKEISFELNFPDPVQFSRLFKNETGLTPGDFKKNGILKEIRFN